MIKRYHSIALLILISVPFTFILNPSVSLQTSSSTFSCSNDRSPLKSQGQVNGDIRVINYSAPNFTWFYSVNYNFTVYSNSTGIEQLFVSVVGNDFENTVYMYDISPGMNQIEVELKPSVFTFPGDKQVSFRFEVGSDSLVIMDTIWIGSSELLVIIFSLFLIAISVLIIVKYREMIATTTSSIATSTVTTGTIGASSGSISASTSIVDDDTSTITYVDQSRAPPGQIFCPECKKLIEEGSIFCPECGTRIPRYLRYRPSS
ncbi:MAG: zinc ribbon domain-containing protein [Promethearchaeota archaeon]